VVVVVVVSLSRPFQERL